MRNRGKGRLRGVAVLAALAAVAVTAAVWTGSSAANTKADANPFAHYGDITLNVWTAYLGRSIVERPERDVSRPKFLLYSHDTYGLATSRSGDYGIVAKVGDDAGLDGALRLLADALAQRN